MAKIHYNYRYLLDYSRRTVAEGGRILDFGCGKGILVEEGMAAGMDFYGAELFSHGSGIDIKEEVAAKGLLDTRIKEIVNGATGFDDSFFDLVVSNQVFEHVPDLGPVLDELRRILKPGGMLLTIFPYQGAYREGHCGVPLAHWFPPHSKARRAWLSTFRRLGMGRGKKQKTPAVWGEYFDEWLAENTFFRTTRELNGLFDASFSRWRHFEDDYMHFRLKQKGARLASKLSIRFPFRPVGRWYCRQFGSWVVLAEKDNVETRAKA